ncbi:Fic family protein [Actinomyces slackii]|uniref:Fic/DOC family n=1 Tax=Actinomyces slackii TaxID=52774 RepID=A0A448KEG4_9ACTO|nr:Fic family protein [Actinomyces slackii]VEG75270.1 Fic/DOC family [Actinomyces slackii]
MAGTWVTLNWQSSAVSGLRPRDRRSGDYQALIPESINGPVVVDDELSLFVAHAERRIRSLRASNDLEAIDRFLLRSEAIASSQIEGIAPSAKNVALAELGQRETVRGISEQARLVANNMTLVRSATQALVEASEVTAADLLALHRSLLPDHPEHHGLRTVQNWLGGSSHHPLDAEYVPPPPQDVPWLIDDLLVCLNGAATSPLIQAALVHAQFETIHPFTNGNGRVGRALIHTVLARRGLTAGAVLPISLVLATLSEQYVKALTAFRLPNADPCLGTPPAATGRDPRWDWLMFFIEAACLACDQAELIAAEVAEVRGEWERLIARWESSRRRTLRGDSTARRLLAILPGAPILTPTTTAGMLEVSHPAASRGLQSLEEAGVLTTLSIAPNRRAYAAQAVLDTITWAERRLASTRFDTKASAPVRAVPAAP